jgi:hypothetical protein
MKHLFLTAPLLSLALLVSHASAQDEDAPKPGMETDWLEFVKGYKGNVMGAEVREVEQGQDGQKLVIAIPKVSMADPDTIEEVRVVGQAPQEIDLIPEFEYEWVDDYDNDFYGLVIRFSDETRWPIRLYLHSDTGFVR